jgi:two-component system, LytTR family, sensor kinase
MLPIVVTLRIVATRLAPSRAVSRSRRAREEALRYRLVMSWRWPTIRARPALLLLAAFSGVGLAQGLLIRLGQILRGEPQHYPVLAFQLTGAIGAWAALPVAQTVVLNTSSLTRRGRARWVTLGLYHVAGYAVFTTLHVIVMRSMRELLLALSIVHGTDGSLFNRFLWEAQNDLVVYASVAGLLTVLAAWAERDGSEARLAEAQLAALSAQVDPHFFYNALNTVSAVMYEDLPKTERLLANLANMMRATLREGVATWTLAEEREHSERYVELLLARFGERLEVDWVADAGVERTQVPRFAVQTLLENAVKHNASRVEGLCIQVALIQAGESVNVVVEDDGAGFAADVRANGNGLARLEQTLELLHGNAAGLERGKSECGGARVCLRLPMAAA